MGYYSKVYIAVPEKDKVLMEVLGRGSFDTKDFNIGKKKFVFFYSDELKWYDMFSDVKPVNECVFDCLSLPAKSTICNFPIFTFVLSNFS